MRVWAQLYPPGYEEGREIDLPLLTLPSVDLQCTTTPCPQASRFESEYSGFNLAAFQSQTRALGPGVRAAIWVQGCQLRCRGCIAPDWIPQTEAQLVPVAHLAERILQIPALQGLTISGGEPMLQALTEGTGLSAISVSRTARWTAPKTEFGRWNRTSILAG